MFKQELKTKYKYLTEYFEQGLNNPKRSISHSILFYGTDIEAQYELAVEIARILNCSESRNENCECLNCRWIKEKQHPAVLTISKIDNKPSDDESKTVISIKQAQMIKNSLLSTSEYHRVFIFCDAKIENDVWTPMGLNSLNFQDETANALLKIIEEPPQNTTFFFLTRDKSDLISTIISRSQSFFVPSHKKNDRNYNLISDIFEEYPNLKRGKSFELASQIFELTKENGEEKVLSQIQNYLNSLLKANCKNKKLKNKIINDMKIAEQAKMMINTHILPQTAIEYMCLNLTKS